MECGDEPANRRTLDSSDLAEQGEWTFHTQEAERQEPMTVSAGFPIHISLKTCRLLQLKTDTS